MASQAAAILNRAPPAPDGRLKRGFVLLWFRPSCRLLNCRLLICAVLLWACALPAGAAIFHVVDSQGAPLQNAVILLPGIPGNQLVDAAIMDQVDKSFVPLVLVIQRGQKVLFPNSDNIRHHVYSFSPAKPFEIKLYAGVPEAPIPFDTAGIVVLGCNIHDRMLGYIVVADGNQAGSTDEQGNLTLPAETLPDSLQVWHPLMAAPVPTLVTLPMPAADSQGVHRIQLSVSAPPPEPKPANGFGNRLQRRHEP